MGSMVTDVDRGWLQVRDHDGRADALRRRHRAVDRGRGGPPLAAALAKATGAERDRAGRIAVEEDLTIPGHPEISVVGDMMSLDKLPGVAEVAMQSGLYAGHRIRPGAGRRRRTSRSATATSARPPTSPAARPSVTAGPLRTGGFLGWWSGCSSTSRS